MDRGLKDDIYKSITQNYLASHKSGAFRADS
jgi:hypothetical protein